MVSEHDQQKALFQWADYYKSKYPALDYMFAVPNGGLRNIAVAKKLKAEGLKAGVPDVYLDYAVNPYHGLRIELKNIKYGKKAGKPTEPQKRYINYYNENNYCALVCWGWKEASEVIVNYLEGVM